MFELTVLSFGGRWLLVDDEAGQIGAYGSRAEALEAAQGCTQVDDEPRHVLICDGGEWAEATVQPLIWN